MFTYISETGGSFLNNKVMVEISSVFDLYISVSPYSRLLAVIELASLVFPEILTGMERRHTSFV